VVPGITACRSTATQGHHARLRPADAEEILVKDDVHRRFQYRITAPVFKYHRGTIDVLDAATSAASSSTRPTATRGRWR
jgi:hypothetical protein